MTCTKECGICLEPISKNSSSGGFSTSCEHNYHNKCITQWLLFNKNCPICRKEFYKNSSEDEQIQIRFTYFTDSDCNMSTQTKHYMMNSIEDTIMDTIEFFKDKNIDIDLSEKITHKNKHSSEIIYFTIKKLTNKHYYIIFTEQDVKLNYKVKFNISKNKNKYNKKIMKINGNYKHQRNRRTKCNVLSF